MQMLLVQSDPFLQTMVLLHFGHDVPPQSISVSSWFCTLSSHDTGAGMREVVMFEIDNHKTLTNTYIGFAHGTNAIGSILTNHCIVTPWTFDTTTIDIGFILIFHIVVTRFSGYS
jgi:hypothetical protein